MKTCTWLFAVLVVLSSCSPQDSTVVEIDTGLIRGALEGNVRVFKGIPYAAPPVGESRWRPPNPAESWDGVREATDFGFSCVHEPYPPESLWNGPEWGDPAEQSEDCLHLNVWTTATAPDESLPVMVWIHGGSLHHESGSVGAYGGANLARKGVVAVTINYRLGPFGFLAHPDLTRESEHGSSGNYGFLDQIAALEWVKRNIDAFGGDPDRVTIFGESAGSWSVNALVASPLATGLFHRAIGQSGAGFGPMVWLGESRSGLPAGETTGIELAKALGSAEEPASLARMRATPASEILATYLETPGARGRAMVDGWVFPHDIQSIFEEGWQNPVPVIVGSNADEGTMFTPERSPTTVEEFRAFASSRYGELAADFLEAYPVEDDDDVPKAFVDSVGHSWFSWQMRSWARLTATADRKAWLYHFTRVPPIPQSEELLSYHGAEIVYVIGNFHLASFQPTTEDMDLTDAMSSYWVNFAATGDPNGEGLPEWPAYDPESAAFMEFGNKIVQGTHLLERQSDFFEHLNAIERAKH